MSHNPCRLEVTSPVDSSADTDQPTPPRPHPILHYTTLRVALFVIALALLWLVRFRGVLLVGVALILSGLASYVLLARQRGAMSAQIHAAQQRRRVRSSARAAKEDDL
jgi:Protein of unknown function (DUF4229)